MKKYDIVIFLRFYKYFSRQRNENSHLALADFHKNGPSSETNLIDSIFLDIFATLVIHLFERCEKIYAIPSSNK